MKLYDIIFPLKLGPLTYKAPDGISDDLAPGTLVLAEVKKTTRMGIVYRPAAWPQKFKNSSHTKLKPISSVPTDRAPISRQMVDLISWMSGYYFTNEGTVLKNILPAEFWDTVKMRKELAISPENYQMPDATPSVEDISTVTNEISKQAYKTLLVHSPSRAHELALTIAAIKKSKNCIVMLPEQTDAELLFAMLTDSLTDRLALYHGGLSHGQRSDALTRIATGKADIVIGSRHAVFAPMPKVSAIFVLGEENFSYKEESAPRYNARDIAVMRALKEKCTAVLSSICPSVESYHNALTAKYTLIDLSQRETRPRVRVARTPHEGSPISKTLRGAIQRAEKRGQSTLIYVNRRGYSMLRCRDCGGSASCPDCNIPLQFFKESRTMSCGYCGHKSPAPSTCPTCGGPNFMPAGAGLERINEALVSLNPVGVDSKSRSNLQVIQEEGELVAVGTKMLTRQVQISGRFSVAGIINADSYRYIPDFRSAERAYQDIIYTTDMLGPGGEVILQVRASTADVISAARNFNFKRFYLGELQLREESTYPPFARLALVTAKSKEAPRQFTVKGCEVLGPVPETGPRGVKRWKYLLKAPTRQALEPALREAKKALKGKDPKFDIDPAKF